MPVYPGLGDTPPEGGRSIVEIEDGSLYVVTASSKS